MGATTPSFENITGALTALTSSGCRGRRALAKNIDDDDDDHDDDDHDDDLPPISFPFHVLHYL